MDYHLQARKIQVRRRKRRASPRCELTTSIYSYIEYIQYSISYTIISYSHPILLYDILSHYLSSILCIYIARLDCLSPTPAPAAKRASSQQDPSLPSTSEQAEEMAGDGAGRGGDPLGLHRDDPMRSALLPLQVSSDQTRGCLAGGVLGLRARLRACERERTMEVLLVRPAALCLRARSSPLAFDPHSFCDSSSSDALSCPAHLMLGGTGRGEGGG